MKQSGYRTVFHIYLIFFMSLLGTLLLAGWLFFLTVSIQAPDGTRARSDWPKAFTEDFRQQVIFIDGLPQIKQAGMELLQEGALWICMGVRFQSPVRRTGGQFFCIEFPRS